MNEKELFALTKGEPRKFQTSRELRIFLETMFEKEFVFPAVLAPEISNEKQWEIHRLPPLHRADSLTVENYLQGLRKLEEPRLAESYIGQISFQSFESFRYPSQNQPLMFARATTKNYGDVQSPQRFLLTIAMDSKEIPGSERKVIGYTAKSSIPPTELEFQCGRFAGPNK
jgi:hypothetical protein